MLKLTTGNKTLVGNASTLGKASRTRSVHDTEDISGLSGVRLDWVGLAELNELLICQDIEVGVFRLELFELIALGKYAVGGDDDGLDIGLVDRTSGCLEQVRVKKHGISFGLDERVGDTLLAKGIIGGNDGNRLGSASVGHGDPRYTVALGGNGVSGYHHGIRCRMVMERMTSRLDLPGGSKEMQLLLGIKTQLAQTRAKLVDTLLVLLVGEEAKGRQLEILPLLVDLTHLAIDILLHLLGLLVHLDELAATNSLVVRVVFGTALDNVIDGMDTLGRAIAEAILGLGMAAGDRFARDLLVARRLDSERRFVHLGKGHNARRVVRHDGGGGGGARAGFRWN